MSRCRRRLVWFVVALTGLIVVIGAGLLIFRNAVNWLDVGEPPRESDYVLVLGGGVEIRPFVAAALVRQGFAKRVLVSHSVLLMEARDGILPPEHELSARVLVSQGVPREDVLFLGHDNASTRDEALALANFLETSPGARVLIPTNEYHTRRARWVFAQVLGERMSQITLFSIPSEEFYRETWWCTEEGFSTIVGENLKLAYYLFRYGWLRYAVSIALVLLAAAILYRRWHRSKRACSGSKAAVAATILPL